MSSQSFEKISGEKQTQENVLWRQCDAALRKRKVADLYVPLNG